MKKDILDSQKAYYNARAREYERSLDYRDGGFGAANLDAGDLTRIQRFVRALPFVESTVELACGTGIWTRELLATSHSLHAVDASQEMIELNRRRSVRRTVTFECADVFHWAPSRQFDRVATAFFLSHVPNELLPQVAITMDRLTTAKGALLIIDEATPTESNGSLTETRELADGSVFEIVKIYRDATRTKAAFRRCYPHFRAEIVAGRFFAVLLSK